MKSQEELKDAADRAFVLLEQKSPHQLAVELVSMEDRVQGAIDACARMQEQRDQLAFQLKDATSQCAVAAGLLRELREGAEIHLHNCTVCKNEQGIVNWTNKLERIDALLAGKLPERPDTEWTDATSTPTAEDYRELQTQHDQLQSKYKAAISKANAWDSLHGWVNDEANNPQMELKERVSRELFNDGCQSAWIHLSRFIEALFEKISDLEDEVGVERKDSATDHPEQPLAMLPEGWQLVPVVPGESMCEAGASVQCRNLQSEADWIAGVYGAMLDAAPKP